MSDTKERILLTALHLFARDGYEAVSVSTIAGKLGMTKGALYKHYKNKRDIFDCIVARMYQLDAEKAKAHQVPEETYEKDAQTYKHTSLENLLAFSKGQFLFWTEDEFASDFRKMLTLEQYRSGEMSKLYHGCLTEGPVSYTEHLFQEMMQQGIMKQTTPREAAIAFFAPLYLLINMSDAYADKKQLLPLLEQHIKQFAAQWSV